jgi:hypothetical protein
MTSGELKWCEDSNQIENGGEMIFVIGIVLVINIVTSFWMERRICALEQLWSDYMAGLQSAQGSKQQS